MTDNDLPRQRAAEADRQMMEDAEALARAESDNDAQARRVVREDARRRKARIAAFKAALTRAEAVRFRWRGRLKRAVNAFFRADEAARRAARRLAEAEGGA